MTRDPDRRDALRAIIAREHTIVRAGGVALIVGAMALFAGLNSYLGNYIGEFLGELCVSLFFLLSALAMPARDSGFPRWAGCFGVVTAVAGLVGMFRNVTDAVAPVTSMNNYFLPLWMIVFGGGLLRFRGPASGHGTPDLHAGDNRRRDLSGGPGVIGMETRASGAV